MTVKTPGSWNSWWCVQGGHSSAWFGWNPVPTRLLRTHLPVRSLKRQTTFWNNGKCNPQDGENYGERTSKQTKKPEKLQWLFPSLFIHFSQNTWHLFSYYDPFHTGLQNLSAAADSERPCAMEWGGWYPFLSWGTAESICTLLIDCERMRGRAGWVFGNTKLPILGIKIFPVLCFPNYANSFFS